MILLWKLLFSSPVEIEIGKIYRIEVNFSNRLDKYGICVCVSTSEFFLINSENKSFYDCIPISAKQDRLFPIYDSFISCSNTIIAESDKIVSCCGQLDRNEAEALKTKVLSSALLTPNQIRDISQSIDNYLNELWDG